MLGIWSQQLGTYFVHAYSLPLVSRLNYTEISTTLPAHSLTMDESCLSIPSFPHTPVHTQAPSTDIKRTVWYNIECWTLWPGMAFWLTGPERAPVGLLSPSLVLPTLPLHNNSMIMKSICWDKPVARPDHCWSGDVGPPSQCWARQILFS